MNRGGKVGVIIPAAGSSQRMGEVDKIFAPLGGRPLLAWSVDTCHRCNLVDQIVVMLNENNLELGRKLKEERGWFKATVCLGGARRQDSVREGLYKLKDCDWVMIHDGARPFLTLALIEDGLEAARETGAAVAAMPVKDTIKVASNNRLIRKTLLRNKLWAIQTPQVFTFDIITEAHRGLTGEVTDDAAAVERLGYKVKLYLGDQNNIKVTTPEDLALANVIARGEARGNLQRVGIGYDSHPLVSGRKLILGGINIPHGKGLLGWSDADVAIHAIIDALFGAADLGDIGTQFPPGEPEYENISSLVLLSKAGELIEVRGFTVANIDVTIMAQRPKLSPYIPEMRQRISQALAIKPTQVTIKATTTDGLGFIGREEGIAAQSVALIQREESERC
jgi:2-C-methyl-D-erythritol 4-phosphate cytidylyltransferase/2-C-methyl-D-erythritol 2,4-cyclodiphosphate synthase